LRKSCTFKRLSGAAKTKSLEGNPCGGLNGIGKFIFIAKRGEI